MITTMSLSVLKCMHLHFWLVRDLLISSFADHFVGSFIRQLTSQLVSLLDSSLLESVGLLDSSLLDKVDREMVIALLKLKSDCGKGSLSCQLGNELGG